VKGVAAVMMALAVATICTPVLLAAEADEAKPFTIIALPDTQIYSYSYPETYLAQTEWIKQQKDDLNIICVVHEGDITALNSEREWPVADRAMSVLDGVVPYCMVVGNHDIGPGGDASNRDATLFNKHFGVERFEKEPWYGGHFPGGNENAYYLIDAAGMKFLVVCLEFGPRDEVLEWANKVVADHSHRRAIVVTHCYLYADDTRVTGDDAWNPHSYPCGGNDGEEIWQKLVRKHENIFLVLSGHVLDDGVGRLTSTGDHGNTVHQVLANYQMKPNGGNGWLRIMKFVPAENKILVSTYSPTLKRHATDGQNQFELEYSMD
jgi:hypothetical protein